MLKHTKLGAILLLAIGFTSCEKSLLDKAPITEYSDKNFWMEVSHADAALAGAYSRLQNAFNTEFIYYGEARADILALDVANNAASVSVINNQLNPNVSFADWGNFYQIIKQANLIIARLPDMKQRGIFNVSNNSQYNRILGQAHALRGYTYFYMARLWGDVPLVTDPINETGDVTSFKTPRTPVAEVYQQVVYDLRLAKTLLPVSYSASSAGHNLTRITVTRGAVDAMLTDYYMWRNNPDSALVFSDDVIKNTQYKLVDLYQPGQNFYAANRAKNAVDSTDYGKMFLQGFSQETIFEIDFNYLEGTNSGIHGIFGNPGNTIFEAHPRIIDKYEEIPMDLRQLVSLINDNQIYKYIPKAGAYSRTTENDKNIILYRLADIMLLRAEAFNATGNRAAAWSILKTIRERVFGPVEGVTVSPVGSVNPANTYLSGPTSNAERDKFMALTMEEAEDVLLDERMKEFAFEGKRWFDLVRTGRAIPIMGPINGLLTQENLLWPISINIIRQNPTIEQNEFYK